MNQQLKIKEYRIINSNMQKEKRQTRLEDFEIEYKLGKGAYGYVFLASKQCQEYAIKEMSKHQLKKQHCEHLPLIEKQVLRMANHPGIVKSNFAFQTSNKLYLALQVCDGGSIEDLCNNKMLNQQAKRFYIAELVDTLDYLRRNGVVHRDLKPSNIMLDKKNHIKVIDFGTANVDNSTLVSDSFKQKLTALKAKGSNKENVKTEDYQKGRVRKRKSSFVGTSSYVCPELLQFNECEHSADLWALGCILYFMYYGEAPFTEKSELQLYRLIKQAEIIFPENIQLNQQAKDLIKKLLVKRPSERLGSCSRQQLSFAALKKHPYIAKFNYDKIFQMEPPNLINKPSNLEQLLEQLSFDKTSCLGKHPLEKMLIKHTEQKGNSICKLIIQKDNIMQEIEIGDSNVKKVYKLQADLDNKIANLLSEKRFSVGVQGCQRLIFTAQDAKIICQYFNNLPEKRYQSTKCFCLC